MVGRPDKQLFLKRMSAARITLQVKNVFLVTHLEILSFYGEKCERTFDSSMRVIFILDLSKECQN